MSHTYYRKVENYESWKDGDFMYSSPGNGIRLRPVTITEKPPEPPALPLDPYQRQSMDLLRETVMLAANGNETQVRIADTLANIRDILRVK